MADIIKFAGISAPEMAPYAIKNLNGTTLHIFDASMVRIIAEALHVRYDVVDGNVSAVYGMVKRSEADLLISGISQAALISEDINFSYPILISDYTFMTNKPEPVSKSLTIFHPFSYAMWIALATVLTVLPLLFYIVMKRKVKYVTILFDVFGYLLEQSLSFEVGRNNTRVLLTSWILGAMIISYGYKAVLLSSLTFPTTTVIRDIPDLVKAISEDSVRCNAMHENSFKGHGDSESESKRAIKACLKRDEGMNRSSFVEKYRSKSKVAILNERLGLSYDERDYFISEDSFIHDTYAYPIAKNFCCPEKLNTLIHRIHASGIYNKIMEEQKLFWLLRIEAAPETGTSSGKISVSDLSGAFFILLIGWIIALLTFIGEIFVHKYSNYK